jgi:membrane associated rhomboid family serine protease
LLQRLLAAPVTTVLFAACIALFAVAESNGSTQSTETLLRYGAAWRGLVWKGEYWRLFTCMFLHIGVVHLVWNLTAGPQRVRVRPPDARRRGRRAHLQAQATDTP